MDVEDRAIAREAIEEAKAKKKFSLFGAKEASKSQTSLPPGTTSSPARKSTSSSKAEDDELPERLSSDHVRSTPEAPTVPEGEGSSEQKARLNEETNIPIHAGFDLKALSVAAAEIKENLAVEELQVPAQSLLNKQHPPERSESAPQLRLKSAMKDLPPSPSTPTAPTPYRTTHFTQSNPNLAGNNDDDNSDLSKRFNDMTFQDDTSLTPVSQRFPDSTLPVKSPYGESVYSRPDPYGFAPSSGSQSADTPTLSFGGADGSVWTPTPATFDSYFPKPVATGTNGSSVNLNQGHGSSTSPSIYSSNPFGNTVYSANPFAASSTLSFGDKDGSISVGSTGLERDPWAPKPIAGSKKPGYAVNPWES